MLYDRRYWKEYGLWFLLFILVMELVVRAVQDLPPQDPRRWAAVGPVLAAIGAGFWIELRNLRRLDELQRLIYLEAMYASCVLAIGWCALQLVLEFVLGYARLSPAWTMLVLGGGFGLGWIIARRRHT
jgi:hypothetical protein